MQVVIDIEGNSLNNPTEIWLIVCKDIATGKLHIFREVTTNALVREAFLEFAKGVDLWIGHHFLGYDYPVLNSILGYTRPDIATVSIDTLVISKLVQYGRAGGHSIEQYGQEFGLAKGFQVEDGTVLESKYFPASFFQQYSKDLENYCVRDVQICHKVYEKYLRIISDPDWRPSIVLEQQFQLIINALHKNGFSFNSNKADKLLQEVKKELEGLDAEILKQFPPKEVLIREFTPKATKFGTISKTSVPRSLHERIAEYEIGKTYRHVKFEEFNPSSHKQLIEVLSSSGWKPSDKTQTHIDTEREVNRLKYNNHRTSELDTQLQDAILKLEKLGQSGWKINENNLATLPESAPAPARTLAKRILLEARRRTLTEWLGLVGEDGRIHGSFYGIGAWTHRMAHQRPNTANIPTDAKLYGGEMRSLWQAPRNRLLVGVDAEGIQLRIFAHYIDDAEFTDALVRGSKAKKTDPHSLNQRILGSVCKSRQDAKRFVYALLLGGGIAKLAQILGCSVPEAEEALDRLLLRYTGFARLKRDVIPQDAKKGFFLGLDGRKVSLPGETVGERKHLCMSGYLQNGEAIIMKKACLLWHKGIEDAKRTLPETTLSSLQEAIRKSPIKIVNFVHDEWQTETSNNMELALWVAGLQSSSLREVGEELKLKCPLAGSYWNEDREDYTIGVNWKVTH